MDDLLSRDPAGEVPADENIVTTEQPGADTTVLSESADPIPQADPEDQGEAFSSVDYSFPDTGENSDTRMSATMNRTMTARITATSTMTTRITPMRIMSTRMTTMTTRTRMSIRRAFMPKGIRQWAQ